MGQIITGTIIIGVGFALIILRERIAKGIVEANNKGGLGFYHYGKRETKILLWQAPLLGLLFTIIGILVLFGVFDFK